MFADSIVQIRNVDNAARDAIVAKSNGSYDMRNDRLSRYVRRVCVYVLGERTG